MSATAAAAAAMLTAHQCLPIQATTMGRHLLLPPATPPARGRERESVYSHPLTATTVLRQVRLHIITYDYAHCSCATQNAVEKLKFRDPST